MPSHRRWDSWPSHRPSSSSSTLIDSNGRGNSVSSSECSSRPSASTRVQPYSSSAARFQNSTLPSRSRTNIASWAASSRWACSRMVIRCRSTASASSSKLASLWRSDSCSILCSVMSRATAYSSPFSTVTRGDHHTDR